MMYVVRSSSSGKRVEGNSSDSLEAVGPAEEEDDEEPAAAAGGAGTVEEEDEDEAPAAAGAASTGSDAAVAVAVVVVSAAAAVCDATVSAGVMSLFPALAGLVGISAVWLVPDCGFEVPRSVELLAWSLIPKMMFLNILSSASCFAGSSSRDSRCAFSNVSSSVFRSTK